MALVYAHRRLDNNQVFYIGITKGIKRPYDKIGRTHWWKNIVAKVGYKVEILIENIEYFKAKQIERGLISMYGRKDLGRGNLVNLTDGGEGTWGADKSNSYKAINQFDLDGNLINSFKSLSAASKSLGIAQPNIIAICKGRAISINNFTFRYQGDIWVKRNYNFTKSTSRKVAQLTIDGELIREFSSITEASRETGISRRTIIHQCKGRNKTLSNNRKYNFKYIDESIVIFQTKT